MNRFRVFSHSIRSLDFKVLAVVGLVILAMAVGSARGRKTPVPSTTDDAEELVNR